MNPLAHMAATITSPPHRIVPQRHGDDEFEVMVPHVYRPTGGVALMLPLRRSAGR